MYFEHIYFLLPPSSLSLSSSFPSSPSGTGDYQQAWWQAPLATMSHSHSVWLEFAFPWGLRRLSVYCYLLKLFSPACRGPADGMAQQFKVGSRCVYATVGSQSPILTLFKLTNPNLGKEEPSKTWKIPSPTGRRWTLASQVLGLLFGGSWSLCVCCMCAFPLIKAFLQPRHRENRFISKSGFCGKFFPVCPCKQRIWRWKYMSRRKKLMSPFNIQIILDLCKWNPQGLTLFQDERKNVNSLVLYTEILKHSPPDFCNTFFSSPTGTWKLLPLQTPPSTVTTGHTDITAACDNLLANLTTPLALLSPDSPGSQGCLLLSQPWPPPEPMSSKFSLTRSYLVNPEFGQGWFPFPTFSPPARD